MNAPTKKVISFPFILLPPFSLRRHDSTCTARRPEKRTSTEPYLKRCGHALVAMTTRSALGQLLRFDPQLAASGLPRTSSDRPVWSVRAGRRHAGMPPILSFGQANGRIVPPHVR